MATTSASAVPRKSFFLEMFTRDISMQDCVLDLIDNSIDGMIRSKQITLDPLSLLDQFAADADTTAAAVNNVTITYDRESFCIEDDCGGIDLETATKEVFNFGHDLMMEDIQQQPRLGAYGIGLKRALFKIGSTFVVESHTANEGFRVSVNVDDWARNDKKLEDWVFPLEELPGVPVGGDAGTKIKVTGIRPDIQGLLSDKTFEKSLSRAIAQTYSPFLDKSIRVTLNGLSIAPSPIPIGASSEHPPVVSSWDENGVKITLIAGLATRSASGEWRSEQAGWYVVCNGRVVVAADKTELTGWGAGILPQYHSSKARGFVGVAFFWSEDSLQLPWTTTKRSLNRESATYLRTRERMQAVARPVYQFLERLYPSDSDLSKEERRVMTDVAPVNPKEVATSGNTIFSVPKTVRRPKTTVKIAFDAERADVEQVKEHLRRPGMSSKAVGEYAFNYLLKQEGLR